MPNRTFNTETAAGKAAAALAEETGHEVEIQFLPRPDGGRDFILVMTGPAGRIDAPPERRMRPRGRRPVSTDPERAKKIADAYVGGESIVSIAQEWGITRQRAWQILRRQFALEQGENRPQ